MQLFDGGRNYCTRSCRIELNLYANKLVDGRKLWCAKKMCHPIFPCKCMQFKWREIARIVELSHTHRTHTYTIQQLILETWWLSRYATNTAATRASLRLSLPIDRISCNNWCGNKWWYNQIAINRHRAYSQSFDSCAVARMNAQFTRVMNWAPLCDEWRTGVVDYGICGSSNSTRHPVPHTFTCTYNTTSRC